jgi:hypothetical protein
VFRRVAVGGLDVATRRDLTAMDPDAQARGDLEFYLSCPGDRSWWRLAETSEGGVAGFAIPSATPYHRNEGAEVLEQVAVLAVPARRGEQSATCGVRPGVGEVRMRQQLLGLLGCRQVGPEVLAEPPAGQLAAQEAGDHLVRTAHPQHPHDRQHRFNLRGAAARP